MTKQYIDDTTLKLIEDWEKNPKLDISYASMKRVVFGLAKHIRNMHDAHEKAFQAGIDYQKMMEKQR